MTPRFNLQRVSPLLSQQNDRRFRRGGGPRSGVQRRPFLPAAAPSFQQPQTTLGPRHAGVEGHRGRAKTREGRDGPVLQRIPGP